MSQRLITRLGAILALCLIVVILVASPVLAYLYRAQVIITESSSNDYDMMAVQWNQNNDWLADNGFMESDALDTRVQTLGGATKPHMVTEDRTLTAVPVAADSQTNLYFTTGETDLASLDIIAGHNGRVETSDAPALEPGVDFERVFDGYIDTTIASRPIDYKPGAYLLEVSAVGTLTAGCINADAYEIVPGGFGAWQDIDCSDYIPDDASGVIVEIDNGGSSVATGVRMNGSTDDRRTVTQHFWTMVGIDDDGIFEVWLTNATKHLYIRGYTDSNWVYKTNATDISIGGVGAWTDIDLTASTESGATAAIIDIVNNDGAANRIGNVRKNGSTDNRLEQVILSGHTYRVVGLDDSEKLEGYIQTADVDFYLMGYCRGGATFFNDAVDTSLGVSGAWTNVDCSADAPDATFLFFELEPNIDVGIGLREEGDTLNTIFSDITSYLAEGIVKCDVNQVIEAYETSNADSATYLSGYSEYGLYPPFPNPTYLVSVTAGAGAITSGVHTVTVRDDGGGNLEIDIDAGTWSNSAAIGAGVTDTSMNWRELISPAVPYTNEFTHTVGGVLQLTYEPVTIIIGRDLPDETNAFDGHFCWGDNPAGVAVSVGSMTSSGQPSVGGAGDTGTSDVLPRTGGTDWRPDAGVSATLAANPMRPIVTAISDNTTLSEYQVWVWFGIIFVAFITVLVGANVRGHHTLTGIAAGAAISLMVVWTVFPLLSIVAIVIVIWGGHVSERSPTL